MENTEILKEIVSKLVGDVETYIPDEICPNDKTKEKLRQYVTNPQFTMDCSDEYDESMNEGYFTLNGLYTARKIVIETLIQHDIMLDEFVKCPSSYIRSLVAKNSWYGLDVLVDDNDERVRIEVAERGYGLDKLINDESRYVRIEVARQGYGLDVLVNDIEPLVRIEVAHQGGCLEKLINDRDPFVRAEVARQGYCLDELVNDESEYVRYEVAHQGYGLEKLINDRDPFVRAEVARHGYGLDKLVDDDSSTVRKEVAAYRNGEQFNEEPF